MGIDYSGFRFAKAARPAKPAEGLKRTSTLKPISRKQRAAFAEAAPDRERVFQRQGYVCFAVNVSKVCTGRCEDPHELIPVGRGGPRESWNRVGICRACHRAAQGRVGGLRLIFSWIGMAEGAKPNADVPGNVTCRWRDRKEAA